MFYRSLLVFSLLLSSRNWALSSFSPVTVSDPQLDSYLVEMHSSENGNVVLNWLTKYGANERIESSQKSQNSSWSPSEPVSDWSEDIFRNCCYVNAKGELFAVWEEEKGQSFLCIAEKIEGKPWSYILNWLDKEFLTSDFLFDPRGKLIIVGTQTVPYKPLNSSKYSHEDTAEAIALSTKVPGQIKQKSEMLIQKGFYSLGVPKMSIDKNGMGYIVWEASKSGGKSLMCQQIVDGHFNGEPEKICPLQGLIFDLEVVHNEKGDIAISYTAFVNHKINGYVLTKTENSWSQPFSIEGADGMKIAIDHLGNVMAVEESDSDGIRIIYKLIDQPWHNQSFFSSDNRAVWNEANVQVDGAGNFVVVWEQNQRNRFSILGSSFSTANQAWSDIQQLSPQDQSCCDCVFSFWAPGKGHIAWVMTPNGFDRVIQVAELVINPIGR